MKTYISILFLIGFMAMNAQNSISGTITTQEGKPIFGAEVYSIELHKGTTTNENGTYNLKNIPNGTMTLKVLFLGYKSIQKTITLLNNDSTVNIVLIESAFEMDEIIIATPFNKLQSENVMKVEKRSMKSIQRTGATTLVEGISQIAGVSQVTTGSAIGKPVIRGLSGNRVLVYTQGIRLENQQFGDEHGLGINQAGIQSIEVIKGPASLLYGSDALGGVLYLNPEKYALENQSKLEFSNQLFSNTLGFNSSIASKFSRENWKFLARGTFSDHADYKIPTKESVTNTRFNEKDFKTGIGYSKNKFSSDLRYNFNQSNLGITEGIADQSTDRKLLEPYQQIDNHILSLHSHIFFANSKLDLDLGYTFNNRSEFEEHEEEGHEEEDHEDEDHEDEDHEDEHAALNMKLKTYSYNLKYHFPKIGNLEILSGIQGLQQTNRNFGEELLIPNADVSDFGVFSIANYEWQHTTLQLGIRYDNRSIKTENHEVAHDDEVHIYEAINNKYKSFNTSLGIKSNLSEKFTTRIHFATGFRAPNLAELTSNGVHHGTNRFEIGNTDLENEKNSQIDISLEYKTEHFEFFINGFHNQIDNYIYITPTGEMEEENPVFTYVQDNAKLYGGEIGFHLHPHPADWLHLESAFETVIGKQQSGGYLPLIPANSWNNTFRTEFNDFKGIKNLYGSINLKSVFAQEKVNSLETFTPAYNLLNLSFGADFKISNLSFSSSLAINNLLDQKYINHLSRLKVNGILNQGRNLVLSINMML